MKKDVLITVKGSQGKSNDVIEMTTMGTCYEKKDKYYINYMDLSTDTEKGTKTTVKILPDRVMIMRFGAVSTQMLFEKGLLHDCPYDTPFGRFDMQISTREISFQREGKDLKIEVNYTIRMNDMPEEEAYFSLHARDVEM